MKLLLAAAVVACLALVSFADYYEYFDYAVSGNCTGSPVTVTVNNLYSGAVVRADVRFQLRGDGGILTDAFENWTDTQTGAMNFTPASEGAYRVSISRPGYLPVSFDLAVSSCPECRSNLECADSAVCENGSCITLVGACGYAAGHEWHAFECCADQTCREDQECAANRCVNLTGACGVAQNHSWVPFTCCADAECGSGACVNHSCVARPQCLADAECPDNAQCANGRCVAVTGDCGFAIGHVWQQYDCCVDADCGAGFACAQNACTPVEAPNTGAPGCLGLALLPLAALALLAGYR